MSKNKIVNKGIIVAMVVLLIGMTFSTSSSNKFSENSNENHTQKVNLVNNNFINFKEVNGLMPINSGDQSIDNDIINDVGYSVIQTVDGGYVVGGSTESRLEDGHPYYSYAIIVKFDENGNEEWNKTYEGLDLAMGTSVQETADNGYIITGFTAPKYEGNVSTLLIKTDDDGNKEWESTFKIMDGCGGFSVQQTSNDDYIISGIVQLSNSSNNSILLIKTDSEGNMIWNNTYFSVDYAYGRSCYETIDGGYIIGGTIYCDTCSEMDNGAILLKTNSEGVEEWNHTFSGQNYSAGYSVQQVNDTGYILSGVTRIEETYNTSVLLLKIDAEGNESWNKTFSFLGSAEGTSIQQTTDNGYIVTGSTGNPLEEDMPDVLLLKTDYYGTEEWNKTIEFNNSGSIGYSIDLTADDGYIITGYLVDFNFDPFFFVIYGLLIKTDINGSEEWNTTFEIEGPEPLVADAGGPYAGDLVEDIQFNGNALGGIFPYSFLWDFGDGNTSDEQNATHKYNATGTYTVTLFVTDYMGKIANDSTNVTITYDDTTPPIIKILTPERALYINNRRLFDLPRPVLIGGIDIEVEASDIGSGIKEVKFYIDGKLRENDSSYPYTWTWNERAFLAHFIKVEAYDNNNNLAEDSITVFTLNLFPVAKYGTLKGKVEYNGTFGMRGIALANVTAESISDSFTKHTFTKIIPFINLGNFTIRLPSGTYTITVEKDGFITQQREAEVILGDNEVLHFELEKS